MAFCQERRSWAQNVYDNYSRNNNVQWLFYLMFYGSHSRVYRQLICITIFIFVNRCKIKNILTAWASAIASCPSASPQSEAAATTIIRAKAKMSFILEFLGQKIKTISKCNKICTWKSSRRFKFNQFFCFKLCIMIEFDKCGKWNKHILFLI